MSKVSRAPADRLHGTHSEVIRAIWCSWVRIASQHEVIRAILLECSPRCWGPAPPELRTRPTIAHKPEAIRAISCPWSRIAPQSEVNRAIMSDDSPCSEVPYQSESAEPACSAVTRQPRSALCSGTRRRQEAAGAASRGGAEGVRQAQTGKRRSKGRRLAKTQTATQQSRTQTGADWQEARQRTQTGADWQEARQRTQRDRCAPHSVRGRGGVGEKQRGRRRGGAATAKAQQRRRRARGAAKDAKRPQRTAGQPSRMHHPPKISALRSACAVDETVILLASPLHHY